jgi:hypothetical protein
LEGVFSFNSLGKRLILSSQTNKRGHYCRIVGNEMSIEVLESKKTLNIMNQSWDSPINNGLNLTGIHANFVSKDDIPKEVHFSLMKFTFL